MHNESGYEYRPSWVDGLTLWIDRQRFPAWAFYLAVYLYMALVLHLVEWFNATLPWGTPSAVQLYNAIWFPWVLGIVHHLDHVARDALRRFAPLLGNRAEIVDSLHSSGRPAMYCRKRKAVDPSFRQESLSS